MEFLGSNASLIIWILLAIFVIKIIKKIIKKAIHVVLIIILLITLGIVPAPTTYSQIDTVEECYETKTKAAALWKIEENKDNNGEKTLYLFNNIPIKIGNVEKLE